MQELRIPYSTLMATLCDILTRVGFEPARAKACAQLFADTSRDGVYTHGIERFPRFLKTIENGTVDIHAEPQRTGGCGAIETWDGKGGPGNLNASACMARAIEISRIHGIGCVGLANTNHWMRGGTYGWQAAGAGVIGVCWTNTMANLPAWGLATPTLGNNPLVIAVPRKSGHVVLDMAISQFSYGALARFRDQGLPLPVPGGFDCDGRETRDPGAIEASQRVLPIGYWKGSGLAMMLDVMAAIISGGQATHQIPRDPLYETRMSQVFIAIDVKQIQPEDRCEQTVEGVIRSLVQSSDADHVARYPGQRVLEARAENEAHGIPVRATLWQELMELLPGPPV